MKNKFLLLLFIIVIFPILSQEDEDKKENQKKSELGLDGFVNASNLGGSFGFGLKYAFVKNENLVFGPSFRLQRMWANNFGQKFGFNIYGGGGFVHYRYHNLLFAGAELEFLKSPLNINFVLSPKKWVPTCFIGGGYSRYFEDIGIRLTAGVFYDIIGDPQSPFWTSYVLRNEIGTPIPVIYRVGFFFPLN
jgi:hypothetical protein